MAKKYGPSAAAASKSKSGHLHDLAKKLGIDFNPERIISNTMNSHCLLDYAATLGVEKQNALMELLFRGYFADGKLISSKDFLLDSAEKVGIDRSAAESYLDRPEVAQKIRSEIDEGRVKYGVNGVPHFVISNESEPSKKPYSFSGAQPPETIVSVFEKLV